MSPQVSHMHRRRFLAAAGLTWLGTALARAAEKEKSPAKSVTRGRCLHRGPRMTCVTFRPAGILPTESQRLMPKL